MIILFICRMEIRICIKIHRINFRTFYKYQNVRIFSKNSCRRLLSNVFPVVRLRGIIPYSRTITLTGMKDATSALNKLGRFDKELAKASGAKEPTYRDLIKKTPALGAFQAAWNSLEDDLNGPEALGHVFSAIKGIRPAEMSAADATAMWKAFRFIMEALGLQLPDPDADIEVPENIKAIADERWAARLAKDWATADALRGKLAELGWAMKDGKDGYKLTKA